MAWTVGARFFAPVQTGPGAHPASCAMGTRSFSGVESGRGMRLTPHHLLVPWSRKGRAIPLFPLWVVRPVQNLCACTRVQFAFFFIPKITCVPCNPGKFPGILWVEDFLFSLLLRLYYLANFHDSLYFRYLPSMSIPRSLFKCPGKKHLISIRCLPAVQSHVLIKSIFSIYFKN